MMIGMKQKKSKDDILKKKFKMKYNMGKMKFIRWGLVLFIMTCVIIPINAQYQTTITLTSGSPNATIKAAMEKNASLLLTEFNNAQGEKRSLSFKGINIDKSVASTLNVIWKTCPFRCDKMEIAERCLKTHSGEGGFQIRNISVIMEPRKGDVFEDNRYQEIVLNYDTNGMITDFCFAMPSSIYVDIMSSDREDEDLRKRSIVVDFVERFRTAYNRKDIAFLEKVFSDDALIITGKVINTKKRDGSIGLPEVEYTSQTKKQYLTRLSDAFKRNAWINVVFEDIKVNRHRREADIYGVKLIQHWNSGTYSDKGYLFLLWDFKNGNNPQIHVRTWQPYEQTPEDQVYELRNFPIRD